MAPTIFHIVSDTGPSALHQLAIDHSIFIEMIRVSANPDRADGAAARFADIADHAGCGSDLSASGQGLGDNDAFGVIASVLSIDERPRIIASDQLARNSGLFADKDAITANAHPGLPHPANLADDRFVVATGLAGRRRRRSDCGRRGGPAMDRSRPRRNFHAARRRDGARRGRSSGNDGRVGRRPRRR